MDLIKLVFQPEAIAVLLIVVSVVTIFMVYSKYAKEAPVLDVRLTKIQKTLDSMRDHVAGTKKSIAELQAEVKPLKQIEPKLRDYSDEVRVILDKALEEEAAEEEKKQIKEHKH